MKPIILVHGGTARIAEDRFDGTMNGIQEAAKIGDVTLQNYGSAVNAVEAAIRYMENNEYFNAGFGSVLNLDGAVEMDASIMDGSDLKAGAVSIVKDVKHPISLARLVYEESPHVMLIGSKASLFARDKGMITVSPNNLVSNYSKNILETIKKLGVDDVSREFGGTVGAVAVDKKGNVAAGTSTGGTNGKLKGTIGDTPIIGCATYADNRFGAVSCTGHSETILRMCLAHSIVKELELGLSPAEATEKCIQHLHEKTGSTTGAICVTKTGMIGLYFKSAMMPWAYIKNSRLRYGIKPEDFCNQLCH